VDFTAHCGKTANLAALRAEKAKMDDSRYNVASIRMPGGNIE
jgi:hypothetical protein